MRHAKARCSLCFKYWYTMTVHCFACCMGGIRRNSAHVEKSIHAQIHKRTQHHTNTHSHCQTLEHNNVIHVHTHCNFNNNVIHQSCYIPAHSFLLVRVCVVCMCVGVDIFDILLYAHHALSLCDAYSTT